MRDDGAAWLLNRKAMRRRRLENREDNRPFFFLAEHIARIGLKIYICQPEVAMIFRFSVLSWEDSFVRRRDNLDD